MVHHTCDQRLFIEKFYWLCRFSVISFRGIFCHYEYHQLQCHEKHDFEVNISVDIFMVSFSENLWPTRGVNLLTTTSTAWSGYTVSVKYKHDRAKWYVNNKVFLKDIWLSNAALELSITTLSFVKIILVAFTSVPFEIYFSEFSFNLYSYISPCSSWLEYSTSLFVKIILLLNRTMPIVFHLMTLAKQIKVRREWGSQVRCQTR